MFVLVFPTLLFRDKILRLDIADMRCNAEFNGEFELSHVNHIQVRSYFAALNIL